MDLSLLYKYPDAERALIEFMRSLTVPEKFERIAALNHTVRAMTIAIIRRRYPTADEHEIRHRLCVALYGEELCSKVHGPLSGSAKDRPIALPNVEV
jgi:hypothetical protein